MKVPGGFGSATVKSGNNWKRMLLLATGQLWELFVCWGMWGQRDYCQHWAFFRFLAAVGDGVYNVTPENTMTRPCNISLN
ncbi:hypothetical protein BaRGS_00002320 [Batillaria attramentaria]|uniref:Uncharacterized protein n=1 Tax=Batillaria attramentaria TaxID=370345 RepID=A0ABD0M4K4_9CAEN